MAWFLLALCAAGAYWFVRHRRVEKTRSGTSSHGAPHDRWFPGRVPFIEQGIAVSCPSVPSSSHVLMARLLQVYCSGLRLRTNSKESSMFHRSSRFLLASIFCGAALAVTSITAQQKELSSANRKIGNAAVEYRDKAIHVVAAYYHSQRNHDSRWLLVESALSTTEEHDHQARAHSAANPAGTRDSPRHPAPHR